MLKIWVFRFFEDACLYAVISVVKSSEQTSFTAGVLKACNNSSLPRGAITLQTAQNFNQNLTIEICRAYPDPHQQKNCLSRNIFFPQKHLFKIWMVCRDLTNIG